ncbi:DUF3455 domain-containing protein [Comamonadaceae bacterium G21597-S1]|nr:DUF3455 domain-containing protein [Comamonadaceae bacterium G21597-S1]
MHVRLVITIAAVAAVSACAGPAPSMAPYSQAGLPAAIQVPAGHMVAMQTMAAGDITWQCRAKADMPGQFEWVFAGPDAGLKDRSGRTVGKYYGPPATWESVDGSRITGKQLAIAPAGSGNIPLQLVQADPAKGMGAMQGVSHVQRVNTRGGVAPAAGCSAASQGEKQVVRYTADYVFWRAAM